MSQKPQTLFEGPPRPLGLLGRKEGLVSSPQLWRAVSGGLNASCQEVGGPLLWEGQH